MTAGNADPAIVVSCQPLTSLHRDTQAQILALGGVSAVDGDHPGGDVRHPGGIAPVVDLGLNLPGASPRVFTRIGTVMTTLFCPSSYAQLVGPMVCSTTTAPRLRRTSSPARTTC